MKANKFLFLLLVTVAATESFAKVTTWPLPDVVEGSDQFQLTVDGVSVPVFLMPPPETTQPGHNPYRYSCARFEATGEVRVHASWKGGETNFTAQTPFFRSIEPFGRTNPLVIVADEPMRDAPKKGDKGVIWFGPGFHRRSEIVVGKGETLYLDGGAWVEGTLTVEGDGARVCGHGVLSGAPWMHSHGPTKRHRGGFAFVGHGRNQRVEGITLWSSFGWTLTLGEAHGVVVDNVKIINGKTGNDDGIDVVRCKDATIRNCFVLCGDDCITPKFSCENLLVEKCTLWCDSANVFRLGYECDPPPQVFKSLVFRDINVLHMSPYPRKPEEYWTHGLVHIDAAREQHFSDILFEDIRYHAPVGPGDMFVVLKTMPINQGYNYPDPGHIERITFRNFRATNGQKLRAYHSSYDAKHLVKDIVYDNCDFDVRDVKLNSGKK